MTIIPWHRNFMPGVLLPAFLLICLLPHPAVGQSERTTARSLFEAQNPNWRNGEVSANPIAFKGMNSWDENVEFELIALERVACLGTCPVYDVLIRANGEVEYNGVAYVDKIGRFTGKISTNGNLRELKRYISQIEYFNLQSIYIAPVSDFATVYTAVQAGTYRNKAILHYANSGPAELWALEKLIDDLIEDVEWRKLDDTGVHSSSDW